MQRHAGEQGHVGRRPAARIGGLLLTGALLVLGCTNDTDESARGRQTTSVADDALDADESPLSGGVADAATSESESDRTATTASPTTVFVPPTFESPDEAEEPDAEPDAEPDDSESADFSRRDVPDRAPGTTTSAVPAPPVSSPTPTTATSSPATTAPGPPVSVGEWVLVECRPLSGTGTC